MRTRVVRAPLVVGLVLVLLGCSSGGDSVPTTTSAADVEGIPQEQRPAFADGIVRLDEYQAGFALFRDCANAEELLIVDVRTDPITGAIDYGVNGQLSPPGISNGSVVDDCFQRYFSFVEVTWQTTDPGLLDQIAQDNLDFYRRVIQPCLDGNGVETPEEISPGSEEFGDLSRKFTELVEAGKC